MAYRLVRDSDWFAVSTIQPISGDFNGLMKGSIMNASYKILNIDYHIDFGILDGDQIDWPKVTAHVARLGADFCGAHKIKFKGLMY